MDSSPGYQPGLHILATIQASAATLCDMHACQAAFNRVIESLGLQKVGEAYHEFPGGGFTAVVALTESHLSIHTWPEHGLATFDVFLSNFLRDNSDKARAVYDAILRHFGATAMSKTEVSR